MKKEQQEANGLLEEGEHIAHDQLLASYAQGTADEQEKTIKDEQGS